MNRVIPRPYPDLATWRDAHGWNQTEAAEYLGVTQTYYSRIERGALLLKGQQAKRIMEKTGVPLEVLVGAA